MNKKIEEIIIKYTSATVTDIAEISLKDISILTKEIIKLFEDDATNFAEWMDIVCIRNGRFSWKYRKKEYTTKEMYNEWLKLIK